MKTSRSLQNLREVCYISHNTFLNLFALDLHRSQY
jgi:hypothetical protein